jgi:hypothetical protein
MYEEELKRVREMTIGELLDTLAQDDYDNYDAVKREKLKHVLCPILFQAGDFYAGKNNVCRGALVIATTAIRAEAGGYLHTCAAEQMTKYLVLLADEMLGARGVGYLPLETLVHLRKIRDTNPADEDEWESWPEKEEITLFPVYQPQVVEPVQQPQAAA